MEAVNSLLFILTTLAPNNYRATEQPPITTETSPADWNFNSLLAEEFAANNYRATDQHPTTTETPPPEWINNAYLSEEFGGYGISPCITYLRSTGPPYCPPKEHYESCAPACQEFCINYTCPLDCCLDGCFCDEGYVRAINGSCVRRDECFASFSDSLPAYAKECGPDEFISCESHCQTNCSNYQHGVPCPRICVLGCVCIPPKIRGPDGNCIFPQECVSTSLATMDDRKRDFITICNFLRIMNPKENRCPMTERQCNNPEDCFYGDDESYLDIRTQVDDETESCFPDLKPEGPMECPPGEHYELCGDVCLKSCIKYDCPVKCCLEGCFCDEGYVRGPNSDCIPKEQCPYDNGLPLSNYIGDMHDSHAPADKVCGVDEIISCNSHCQKNCTNLQELLPCPNICVLDCVCKLPKIRGPNGDCILLEQCVLSSPKLDEASKKDMMVRNFLRIRGNEPQWDDAHSIKDKQCDNPFGCSGFTEENSLPSPQGQYRCTEREYMSLCTTRCPDTCDNYRDKSRACNSACLPFPQCVCKAGFVRGPNGDCITPQECPIHAKEPKDCPVREYYDTCGPVCEDDCRSYFSFQFDDHPCLDKSCKEGCFCRPGLIRGNEGRCIWPILCYIPDPEPYEVLVKKLNSTNEALCPENEEWQFCGTACPKNCTNYDKYIPCISKCSEGCFCKEPRVRGPDGKCILIEECPLTSKAGSVCPENEYFEECHAHCQKNCTNYDQDFSCLPICVSGCVCKPPMVRGPSNRCIDIEECPRPVREDSDLRATLRQLAASACKENEIFTSCKSVCPDTCYNDNEGRLCKSLCLPGCACKPGYVLSRNGVCIEKELCVEDRTEDCSELEVYKECGSRCEMDCFNYSIMPPNCDSSECRKGCFCKPGWVRSPGMKCIRPYECRIKLEDIQKKQFIFQVLKDIKL